MRRDWLGFERVQSEPVSLETLTAVHPASFVEKIRRFAERGGGHLDLDTIVSSGSYEAALHAAGGAVGLVDALLDGRAPSGFSAHRPPGHHAERARAMGFCLFNNIAVAARHALDGRGLKRVMILDWDVHHGNGTSEIFWESDQVLFVSIHQSPLYPGTGSVSEVGAGAGRGFTVNLPVPPESGDEVYLSLIEHVAVPLALEFGPQLLLVSAGYDAHRDDPLANCNVTSGGFAAMTGALRRVCAALDAPVGCLLEGGYALDALSSSVVETMGTLRETVAGAGSADGRDAVGVAPVAREALARLRQWWPGLG